MRTIISQTRVPFLVTFLLTLLLINSGCEKPDEILESQKSAPDAQIRMNSEWSGELTVYLDSEEKYSLNEIAERTAEANSRQAIALLPAEPGNKIAYSKIAALVADIEAENGPVTSLSVESAAPGGEFELTFSRRVPVNGNFVPQPDNEDPLEGQPVCKDSCKKFGDIQLLGVVGNNFKFAGNCAGQNGVNVVIAAMLSCFSVEVTATNKGCPVGCFCNYTTASTKPHTRNCFANGKVFVSGGCTLTINGQITLTVALTTQAGVCKKIPNPGGG